MRFTYDERSPGVVETPDGITALSHIQGSGTTAVSAAVIPYGGTHITVAQVVAAGPSDTAVKLSANAPPGAQVILYATGSFTLTVFPPDGVDFGGDSSLLVNTAAIFINLDNRGWWRIS